MQVSMSFLPSVSDAMFFAIRFVAVALFLSAELISRSGAVLLNEAQQKSALKAHNDFRMQAHASDMMSLVSCL